MKVSIFKRISETKNGIDIFIDEVLLNIKNGKWQDICLKIASENDKQKRTELKTKVPYFTASGTFETRNNKGLKEHSGLIAIDFDDVDNVDMYLNLINRDIYTFASFKSISHRGFCVLVKIDSNKHLESFEGLANYYYNLLKIPIDPACKDISRPRYISYDPDAFLCHTSKIFKEYPKKEHKKEQYQRTRIDYLHTNDRFDRVLKQIIDLKKDITGDYNQWVRIGFAIASQFGESGEDYFDTLSQFSTLYDCKVCSRQYKFCLRNKPGITISTFYYYAKINGIKISDTSEDYQAKIAHFAKQGGRDVASVKKILEIKGETPNDAVINAVFESNNFTPANEEGKENKLNIDDVEIWINTNYSIKKNEITRFYENNGVELQTEDFNSIFIKAKKAFDKLSREIFDTIIFSKFTPTYNPIFEYLDQLSKNWDKVDRIDQLCKSITSNTGTFDYRKILLQSWLLGIIESVYTDEPNILQLILAGKQNTGKSVFFKKLLPKQLKQYFALSQLDKGRDDELLMCQKLLILDDEYSGKSKLDAKLIKRLLSAPSFDLREPYGRRNITLRRIATLAATSNETELLNDPTGNRRNIIFEVDGKFDYDLYNAIDKEQIFAQLTVMHKQGFSSQLTNTMIDLIDQYTGVKHSEVSIEGETISMLFESYDMATDYDFMTTTQIKNIIETNTVQKLNTKKLGMELRRMGYKRVQKYNVGYGYLIVPKFQKKAS